MKKNDSKAKKNEQKFAIIIDAMNHVHALKIPF